MSLNKINKINVQNVLKGWNREIQTMGTQGKNNYEWDE